MRVYRDVHTVVELTEEQRERLKSLIKEANDKGGKWTEKKALELLTMVRCPEYWDIQLSMFEKAILQ